MRRCDHSIPLSGQNACLSPPPPLKLKKKKAGGVGREKSYPESKIRLDMPDFPIKKKGFQNLCAVGVQK